MRVLGILLIATFSGGPIGRAQESEAPPNEPPHLWRASASEREGQVIVRIANPEYVAPREAVPAEAMRWRELKPVALGGSAHAFGVDGRRLGAKALLDALRDPKGVAVFVRFNLPLLEPDRFYLAMLRESTIVLVVAAEAISDPIP